MQAPIRGMLTGTEPGQELSMPKSVMVHEKALCESEHVGDGTRIWAFAHIMEAAVIGQNCNIGECCFIESGATLGNNVTVKNGVSIWQGVTCEDDVFFGPSCVLTNDLNPRAAIKKDGDELLVTIIRKGTTIGANATILCDLTIGTHAFIGAGAVVISDVQ
jgi:UDP-3-O-[3-hydroxymyristoyl] glucosamine N-acyltransferase